MNAKKYKHLYTKLSGKAVLAYLSAYGVKGKLIGTLPSNHDIDILVDENSVPSNNPRGWLRLALKGICAVSTDLDSYFVVSAVFGHVDIFFSDPEADPSNHAHSITDRKP